MAMVKKIKVDTKWIENFLIEVKARNHIIYVDQPEDSGGKNKGITPLEHLLAALGSCICSMAVIIAKQKNIELKNFDVSVEGEIDYDVLLGKSKQPRPGFYKIVVKVKVDAALTDIEKKEFIKEIQSRCPVADGLMNITPVEVIIE
ncbi:OsmC family protein [Thermodesulfovibrio yellowstonii]|uniref:OsmC family peroxiredoxin n=1 Tax=Thermodesulfovibrio yellowstonii TaxID=28262 RepID=A0A9W6GHC4_9BACT|nr:OsmC family protein [Thermodesulfovibrio islandicus]GLI53906.1 hypothetical protein TISLANDTSLP1_15990 [Thermodesulfovibrio islandicus]